MQYIYNHYQKCNLSKCYQKACKYIYNQKVIVYITCTYYKFSYTTWIFLEWWFWCGHVQETLGSTTLCKGMLITDHTLLYSLYCCVGHPIFSHDIHFVCQHYFVVPVKQSITSARLFIVCPSICLSGIAFAGTTSVLCNFLVKYCDWKIKNIFSLKSSLQRKFLVCAPALSFTIFPHQILYIKFELEMVHTDLGNTKVLVVDFLAIVSKTS